MTIVGAAGLAFAGWTALEIWFGQALKGALPPVYLDAVSGGLFLLFGVLLVRSIPEDGTMHGVTGDEAAETDGGVAAETDLDVSVGAGRSPTGSGTSCPSS